MAVRVGQDWQVRIPLAPEAAARTFEEVLRQRPEDSRVAFEGRLPPRCRGCSRQALPGSSSVRCWLRRVWIRY
jgi:hypothetical protein